MTKNQPIIVYLLVFLILSLLIKITGLIDIEILEIAGYALIFYGISLVYISMGRHKPGILFLGTFLFLTGIVFFLLTNFAFNRTSDLIFPSLLFICGIGMLMVFFDNLSRFKYFIIALTLLFTGTAVTAFSGSSDFSLFPSSLLNVTLKYWPVALIVLGIILIIYKDEKRKE